LIILISSRRYEGCCSGGVGPSNIIPPVIELNTDSTAAQAVVEGGTVFLTSTAMVLDSANNSALILDRTFDAVVAIDLVDGTDGVIVYAIL